MPADHQIEAARRIGQVLGVGCLEADRECLRLCLSAGQFQHRRCEVDPDDPVSPAREFQRQKPGAAADVERIEGAAGGHHEVEDAVPGGAFGGSLDAVPEILVEMRRTAVPVGRDLLLYRVKLYIAHFSPTTSARASTCSAWLRTGFSSRWLAPIPTTSSRRSRTCSGVPWMPHTSTPGGLR